jgi:hypothetical protein
MTVDILQPKRARTRRKKPTAEELTIGERDSNIFDCPACARPLSVGSTRCPGCGTRLVAGVQAKRAVAFMAIGLVAGLMIGGGVMAGVAAVDRASTASAAAAAAAAAPAVRPSAAPAASALPTAAPIANPAIPVAALSALRQTALLHQRIVTDADHLATALAASKPTSVDIAKALRALSSDALFGARIAPTVGSGWTDAASVSSQMVDFYAAVTASAKEGLSVSLQATDAYVDAGHEMLKVVGGLTDVDAASRDLAASAGVELPAVLPVTPAP